MSPVHIATTALRLPIVGALLVALIAWAAPGATAQAVQPGAPGEPSRILDDVEVRQRGAQAFTAADVQFMQHMIVHHAQAVEMTRLVPDRTSRPDILSLARRIQASQADEIALMQRWLSDRGAAYPNVSATLETRPDPAGAPAHHGEARHAAGHDHPGHTGHARPEPDHDHLDEHHAPDHHGQYAEGPTHEEHQMAGMLTSEQIARLASVTDSEFDRLFLEYMIYHHEGALIMVSELFASAGAGQETAIFQFASHVESDQRGEIDRMGAMLNDSPHHDHTKR
jgi:uncharacterized protein (DUF305 family)